MKHHTSQEIFYRYEATGDPTSKDGTSDTRFSWDIEKGNWIPKSEWLEKMIGPTERVRVAAESSEADPIDPVSVETDMETDVPAVEESAKDIASDNINKMESEKSKENVVDDAETEEDIQGEVEDCPSKIIKLKSGPMGVDGKKRKRAHSPPPSPQTQQPEEPDIASRSSGLKNIKRLLALIAVGVGQIQASGEKVAPELDKDITGPPPKKFKPMRGTALASGHWFSLGTQIAPLKEELANMMRKEPDAEPAKPSDSTGEELGMNTKPKPVVKNTKSPEKRATKKAQPKVSQVVLDGEDAVLDIDATPKPEERQKKPEARRVRKKPQPAVAPVVMEGEVNFQWADIAPKLEKRQRKLPTKRSKKITQPAVAPAVSVNEGVILGDHCSP
ncbi:hypothetical protein PABG_02325 [Paracoccidioides brasiliensis Pb03]|nr:hypothetical protein PABG_02325 [Paracoccidioides brasiliensis Pb03]